MIYGIGTDICTISRIEKLLKKEGERFAGRILTPQEISAAGEKTFNPTFLAKRWAAKEAVSKALGVGIGAQLSFQDITVSKTNLGQPTLAVSGKFSNLNYHLSLGDEAGLVVAMVVVEEV